MTPLVRPVSLVASIFLLAACKSDGPAPDWSYSGDTGPSHWAELSDAYSLAATGTEQSPIDIEVSNVQAGPAIEIQLDYEPHGLSIFNNGHTVEDEYTGGGQMVVDGHGYDLAQFHFHSPSEHTIDGEHAAIEMHLVHKDADGALAVLAVMIVEGAEHPKFGDLEQFAPRKPGRAEHQEGVTVDVRDLLPASTAVYRYPGSLTTPPCSEGVAWFVLREPIQVSAEQIATFRQIFFGNNRPTQPLNGRAVVASR